MSVSPLSARVLIAATVVSSPALWLELVDRTLPLDVALTRYLVALVLSWVGLSVVTTWAFPSVSGKIPDQAARTLPLPDDLVALVDHDLGVDSAGGQVPQRPSGA